MKWHPADNSFIDIHSHHAACAEHVFRILNVHLEDFRSAGLRSPVSTGLHPWHIHMIRDEEALECLLEEASGNMNVVALGETGVDKTIPAPIERQEKIFRLHARISKETDKPLIIHCVKAFQEILKVKKEMQSSSPAWILHGFNSSPQMAEELVSHGFYISFGARLLLNETKSRAILARISRSKIFAETDDQDHSIEDIYQKMMKFSEIGLKELQEQILENYLRVFRQ